MTLTDLRFLPVILLIVFFAFISPIDPDLWWHLKTGERIVEDLDFVRSDPFSWTAGDRAWYLHEWLSEAIFYWGQSRIGFPADVAIAATVIGATQFIVYRLAIRVSGRDGIALALILLSTVMLLAFIRVRPQAFSWLLFAVFMRQLYLHFRGEQVALAPLPFLMALWSNLHLGYLFGLMVVYLWLGSLLARDGLKDLRPYRGPALIAILCTLAPSVSPIGPEALVTPFAYVGSGSVAVAHIQEWASPDFHHPAFASVLVALGVLLYVGLPHGRKNVFALLLCLAVVALALIARRNIPLLAVALPVVVADSVAQRWPRGVSPPKIGSRVLNTAIAGAALLATVAFVINVDSAQTSDEPKAADKLPSQGVAYVLDHDLGERMLNNYNWGGFLMYHLYPDSRVSIDGRSDLYGDDILREYFDLIDLEPGWRDELARMDPDFILLPKDEPMSGELLNHPGWELAFEGPVEMIFVPAEQR